MPIGAALSSMGYGIMNRSSHSPAAAIGMMLADTAVGFGGSVALGEVYGRYADKSKLAKYSPEILGGVGKVAEALLLLFVGPGFSSGIAGSLGQVGVNAIGLELGLNHARKAAGVICAKLPAGTDISKLKSGAALPAGSIAVGALPAADAGRGLSWDHIQELAHSC